MKKYIPNILTTYRLVVALLIPILFFKKLTENMEEDAWQHHLPTHWQVI